MSFFLSENIRRRVLRKQKLQYLQVEKTITVKELRPEMHQMKG